MLECDYLVVGTGASAMAFVDVVMSQTTDRTVIMVDKLPEPGGHWNHAYDFVRLHQPACYYGVPSEKLEREGETALYKFEDLSNKKELLAYFRLVLDKLLRTGRVFHYGECTYNHDNWNDDDNLKDGPIPIQSFVDKEGISHKVQVKRRVVDGTYLKITVPSTNPPKYNVDPGVDCVAVNGIYKVQADKHKKYVIVGSGKTGVDAALHLMDNGVDPANITWVMPRDAWFFNRTLFNPQTFVLNQKVCLGDQPSTRDSFLYQEKMGLHMRLDKNRFPEKHSCATVERNELVQLQSIPIGNVIRKGRVSSITKTHLLMRGKDGKSPEQIPYDEGSIVVDCSSTGLPPQPGVPIFQGRKIILSPVDMCLICNSASIIAYVDCHDEFKDDDDRNRLLVPIPYPNSNQSYVRGLLLKIRNNLMGYGMDPRTKDWYDANRLNIESHTDKSTIIRMRIRMLFGEAYATLAALPKTLDLKKKIYKVETGKEFEYELYSPKTLNKMIGQVWVITMCFRLFLIALFVGLFFCLRLVMERILY